MPKKDVEFSESGSPIYTHQRRERDWTSPGHPTRHLDEIEAHVEKYIGKIETVFHEIISDLVHIDILFIQATTDRPFHVLVTSGVGDERMTVPDGLEDWRYAELLIALPAEWPLSEDAFRDEANYWPVRWLKQVGRLPHEYQTWIGWGHTIPNGDPPEPIANTGFAGVMLGPPWAFPPDFFRLTTQAGDVISFFNLMPLYPEELDLKLKQGAEALEKRLGDCGIDFVLDTKRANAARVG